MPFDLCTTNGQLVREGLFVKNKEGIYEVIGFDGFYGGDFALYLSNLTNKSHVIKVREIYEDGSRSADTYILTPEEISKMEAVNV